MRPRNGQVTAIRKAPFFVGIDVGKQTHSAAVVDANGSACLPKTMKFATKPVFVDGARGLARDLQTFDDIVDQQRMVILASPNEIREIDLPVFPVSATDPHREYKGKHAPCGAEAAKYLRDKQGLL